MAYAQFFIKPHGRIYHINYYSIYSALMHILIHNFVDKYLEVLSYGMLELPNYIPYLEFNFGSGIKVQHS